MRITNGMMVNTTINNMYNNLTSLSKTYEKLATGKQFSRASDNPVGAAQSMRIESDLLQVEQYQSNIDAALSYSQVTETAVSEVEDILQRARELTVKAANGTNGTEDTELIAAEMEQLRDQLIKVGNTTYVDEYIFSGYKTDQPLFSEDGGYNVDMTSEFVYDRNSKTYQVGVGSEVEPGVNGLDIFGYVQLDGAKYIGVGEDVGDPASVASSETFSDTEVANGDFDNLKIKIEYNGSTYEVELGEITDLDGDTDIDAIDLQKELENQFSSIFTGDEVEATITGSSPNYSISIETAGSVGSNESLKVDVVQATESSLINDFNELIEALNTGDTDTIEQSIDTIDGHIDNTLSVLASIGARQSGMELTSERLDENYLSLSEIYSEIVEIDFSEVATEMSMKENIYQASLAVGGMIIQPTLVDFIS